MKAAVLYELNRPLVIEDLELPKLHEGQVLVQMLTSGVCQTQLLEARGRKGEDKFLPHAMGHEGTGKVLEVGPGVQRVRAGDMVVLSWIRGPGLNSPGPKYRNQKGQTINAGAVATFCEQAIVSENRCTPISNAVDPVRTSLLGCAIPTGAGIVQHQLSAKPDQSIVVFGIGGIGASAILMARHLNLKTIVAIDVQESKKAFALGLGASHFVSAKDAKGPDQLKEIAPQGFDFAIECSGSAPAMESAYPLVKDNGGLLVIAGNLPHGQKISLDPFNFIRGKNIIGSAGGSSRPAEDFPLYLKWNQDGTFPMEKLITKIFRLEQINEALDQLEHGVEGRLLIDFRS